MNTFLEWLQEANLFQSLQNPAIHQPPVPYRRGAGLLVDVSDKKKAYKKILDLNLSPKSTEHEDILQKIELAKMPEDFKEIYALLSKYVSNLKTY